MTKTTKSTFAMHQKLHEKPIKSSTDYNEILESYKLYEAAKTAEKSRDTIDKVKCNGTEKPNRYVIASV